MLKKYDDKEHQQDQLQGKIASTNSSGLVMKPEMVVLESLLQRNGLKRCLKLNMLVID